MVSARAFQKLGLGLWVGALILVPALTVALAADKPAADKPVADKPVADKPAADKPAADATVVADKPLEEKYPELKKARDKFVQMDFEGALLYLKQVTDKNPDLPPAQIFMAQMFAQAQRAADARISLERAVSEDPTDPSAYVLLAELALNERRVSEAELMLAKANTLLESFTKSEIRKKDLTIRTLAGLASVSEAREKWAEAQKRLEAWVATDPKSAVAEQRLARAFFSQEKIAEALACLRASKKLDNSTLTPEAILARFFAAKNEKPNAENYIREALKADAGKFPTELAAAQLFADLGNLDEAKKHVDKAIELDPNSLEAKLTAGVIALFSRKEKDYDTAVTYFETVLHATPSNFAASNNLALALAEQKDEKKLLRALEYASVNVRQYAKQPEAYSTYGWVCFKAARYDEAEQALRTAVSAGTATPETAYYLACVLAQRERTVEARRLVESALKSTESRPFWYLRNAAKNLLRDL